MKEAPINIDQVTKDPIVKQEAKRWGGPKSLLGRALLAVSLVGGGAGLVACGESQVDNPASFTINTGQASEVPANVIEQAFKDVPRTEIVMRVNTPFNEQPETWHKNSANLSQDEPFFKAGSLTILTDRTYSAPEANKQWRAFAIDDRGNPLVIGEVRSASAETLINKDQLAPEDRNLEAVRVFLSSRNNQAVSKYSGFRVYLQQIDTTNYSADQASLRAIHIAALPRPATPTAKK